MEQFDYIIVGAGSAGCVLANRLSANPSTRVLLIEAGLSNNSLMVSMPKGFAKLVEDTKYVRQFKTTQAEDSGVRPETWPRGVMLGGSSSLNGMHYSRGQPQDFDDWAEAGCTGWGWDEISRCYREMEDTVVDGDSAGGVGGPLRVSVHPSRDNPLNAATIEAGVALGLPRRADVNQPDQEGIGYMMRTIRDGKRESSATAFLKPIGNRKNLKIVTGTLVERVLFDGMRAIGVACRHKGVKLEYRARGEVILSAGAIQSPQLLQLSGIGPAAALRELGIQILSDSAGVGQNMRDHWAAMIQYRVNGRYSHNREYSGIRLISNALRYLLFKDGIMASSPHEVEAYVRTRPDLVRADVQLMGGPFSLTRSDEAGKFDFDAYDGMQFCAYQMRPESQGSVMIESTDAAAQPIIRPQFLATDLDRTTAISMVRYVRRLFAQAPLQRYVGAETLPGASAESDEEILESVRRTGTCLYHAVGTCKMGADSLAVVDSELRVKGVDGLRVVDGSVMPTLVSGFTNGPVMAMAWRAADIILK